MVVPCINKRNTDERTGEVILVWGEGRLRLKFCFDLLKFEMPVRHPRSVSIGNLKLGLEFRREVGTREINMEFISMEYI